MGDRPTDRFEATTARQKGAERIGQALYGQLLAAGIPLGSLPAKATLLKQGMTPLQILGLQAGTVATALPRRLGMGAALGTGFTGLGLAKEAIEKGQLPTKERIIDELKEVLCDGCESITCYRGSRDSTGFQIEPDSYSCPCEGEPELILDNDNCDIDCKYRS